MIPLNLFRVIPIVPSSPSFPIDLFPAFFYNPDAVYRTAMYFSYRICNMLPNVGQTLTILFKNLR